MKIITIGLLLPLFGGMASCQKVTEKSYGYRVLVVDDEGAPVEDASVKAMRYSLIQDSPIPAAKSVPVYRSTDENGVASILFDSAQTPGGVAVSKNAYYPSTAPANWIFPEGFWDNPTSHLGKTAKAEMEIILRPARNPIPMHAYNNAGAMDQIAKIPELNKEYGYDLKMSEPLPPLGKGLVADFTFVVAGSHDGESKYDLKLELTFSNPFDGVVEFLTPQRTAVREPIRTGSILISDYEAPLGGYGRKITRSLRQDGIGNPRETDVDFHRNFYFRTRTVTDASGKVLSAHYGKIYGDFQFDPVNEDWGYLSTLALVTTYFNPTPNDRNVEFDPNRNLNADSNVQQP